MTLGISVPHESGLAIVVFASRRDGPSVREVCVLDHATGTVLQHVTVGQFPLLGAWSTWNYSLHVGSVLGMPTKILWLIACLVLIVLPFTGIWMWWQRKPQGRLGLPASVAMKLPLWLQVLITLLSILLPAVGVSIIVIAGVDWLIQIFNHSPHRYETLHDVTMV